MTSSVNLFELIGVAIIS